MSFEYDRPEGLLGAMIAIEGIKDSVTLLNGPTGCKFYPASLSEASFPHRRDGHQAFNPYRYRKDFYFSQPRIPCTFMDGNDYIMGTRGKLDCGVDSVLEEKPSIIGLINTPGASLTGEDLALEVEPDIPVVRIVSPDYSVSSGEGFQDCLISVLESIRPKMNGRMHTVNLLGISIWHLGWRDSITDLTKLLDMCGISVNVVIGAGWSVSDISRSGDADLNAVLHEEYGGRVAEWYEKELGMPYVSTGVPLGFENLERWVCAICDRLNRDASPALAEIRRKRERAAKILSGLQSSRRPPRGSTFSISSESSLAYAVTEFLYSYLGMVPVAVNTGLDRSFDEKFRAAFDDWDLEVNDDVFNIPADVVLGDGCLIATLMQRNMVLGGVDVSRPGLFNMNFIERPVLGLGGTMRLLDSVLNILERCGQTH